MLLFFEFHVARLLGYFASACTLIQISFSVAARRTVLSVDVAVSSDERCYIDSEEWQLGVISLAANRSFLCWLI
jgi:hypothetical protein